MKAVTINQNGGVEVLRYVEDFPKPGCKPNEVLVRVYATSLNNVDIVLRRGYPGLSLNFPHILGGDVAGVIEEVGEKVNKFKPGERVVCYPIILPELTNPKFEEAEHISDGWKFLGMHINGSYAEYVTLPEENVFKIADSVSFEEAATLPIAGLTSYYGLVSVAKIRPDDVFFIWGGTSGVGMFAIQIAKLMGAKVIATVGQEYKKQYALQFGADYVFNHNTDDVVGEVRKIFPNGVDIVFDYVGTQTFEKSLSMLAKKGKLVVFGFLTGREVSFNIQPFYLKHQSIHGIYMGNRASFEKLVQLTNENKIKVHIHSVFDLKEIANAHNLFESGEKIGKIVVRI